MVQLGNPYSPNYAVTPVELPGLSANNRFWNYTYFGTDCKLAMSTDRTLNTQATAPNNNKVEYIF